MSFDPIQWIQTHCPCQLGTSVDLIYDRTESQSGGTLPVIYVPFDGRQRGHFVDRGQILDFALSVGDGHVLDFGPGDGWPSLLLAPLVRQVTGVDGSARRVRVCTENAERLGIGNARFAHVAPGQPLPFPDGSFDGITAASSIEQTPDPQATLRELYRVLKPGGRLRIDYESLNYYRGNEARAISIWQLAPQRTCLLLYDRRIEHEQVLQYGLTLSLGKAQVRNAFDRHNCPVTFAGLSEPLLQELGQHLVAAGVSTTTHPSCRTLLRWLKEAGFRWGRPTAGARVFVRRLFDALLPEDRPVAMGDIDRYLRPIVRAVIDTPAYDIADPGEWEPPITAVK